MTDFFIHSRFILRPRPSRTFNNGTRSRFARSSLRRRSLEAQCNHRARTRASGGLYPHCYANRLAFAVIDEDTGKIVGSTSLYHIDPAIPRLYIGFTWYALSARRTRINTACKIMLLDYVFDTLNCRCACWQTDNLNTASQRAIERLGAHQDGILRCHSCGKTAACAIRLNTACCVRNGRRQGKTARKAAATTS